MTTGEGAVWAVVVAAGRGDRFGGPKQGAPLAGRRVLDWALAGARSVADGLVLVVTADQASAGEPGADVVVAGGATRSASVRAGLAAVPSDAGIVVVHDAARPLAPAGLFIAVVAALGEGADAVVPGVAVADTLRWRRGGPVDRDAVVAVQTPQAFRAAALRAAHAGQPEATDDASLVEAAGGRVVVVEGDPRNRKITDQIDLAMAEAAMAHEARS